MTAADRFKLVRAFTATEVETLAAWYDRNEPEAAIGTMLRAGSWFIYRDRQGLLAVDSVDDDSNWLGLDPVLLRTLGVVVDAN